MMIDIIIKNKSFMMIQIIIKTSFMMIDIIIQNAFYDDRYHHTKMFL